MTLTVSLSRAPDPRAIHSPRPSRPMPLAVAVGGSVAFVILSGTLVAGRGPAITTLPLSAGIGVMLVAAVLMGGRPRVPPLTWLWFGVLGSGLLGGLVGHPSDVETVAGVVFLAVLWLGLGQLGNQMKTAVKIIIWSGLLLAAVCVAEAASGRVFLGDGVYRGENPLWGGVRAQGTVVHPLVAGFVLLGALILLVLSTGRGVARLAQYILLILGIAATGSSSPFALAVAVGLLALAWPRRGSARLLGTAAAVVLAAVSVTTLLGTTRVGGDLQIASNAHRLASLLAAPRLILDRPVVQSVFGTGWDSVEDLFRRGLFADDRFYAIDNMFVAALACGGVAGFLAYGGLLVGALTRVGGFRGAVAVLAVAAMGLSFDTLLWPVAGAVVATVLAAAASPIADDGPPRDDKAWMRAAGTSHMTYWVRRPLFGGQ